MIPARIGSQRFKKKNLALIRNKSILEMGIEKALNAKIFDEIIVNGDNEIFEEIALSKGVSYYKRSKNLGSSSTKSDDVVYDFLKTHNCENIVWFNSIAPLQSLNDIVGFTKKLKEKNIDSLFATKKEFLQAIYKKSPLNYSENEKFPKTQDLEPVNLFVPSLMGWKSNKFIIDYVKKKYAFFCGNICYFEVSNLSSLVIKTEQDFRLIRSVFEGIESFNNEVKYFKD